MPDFPFADVHFSKDGKLRDEQEVVALLQLLAGDVTDLVTISHGWNNDEDEARRLYDNFAASAAAVLGRGRLPGVAGRQIAFLRIYWPSKKFDDDDEGEAPAGPITGHAASLGGSLDREISHQFDILKDLIDDPQASAELDGLAARIDELEDDPELQDEFLAALRKHLSGTDANFEDASDRFFSRSGRRILADLSRPIAPPPRRPRRGGAATIESGGEALPPPRRGHAAMFSLGGLKSAVNKVLNMTTYYEMKSRAGKVGRDGVCPLLRRVHAAKPALKLHLVGHSFGGRLVTAVALAATEQPPLSINSMSLLQAAFSHNGFAKDFDGDRDGFFRNVVARQAVTGPVIITHTVNDRAVGRLYPLASQLVGEDAAAIQLLDEVLDAVGGPARRFGGLGRNGAQHTPEAIADKLLELDAAYSLSPGRLHNLEAGGRIKNHSDVSNQHVAQAVLAAIGAT